jgi:hypothetical protein
MNRRRFTRTRTALASAAVLSLLTAAPGCMDRPVAPQQPTTVQFSTQQYRSTEIDKIDLLFMIDNSASMADKQDILAAAVPDLVKRLTQPRCLDDQQHAFERGTDGKCPGSSRPEFRPITDIHVGVITSSLGGAACSDPAIAEVADMAHLITRKQSGGEASSYDGKKFLFWDPEQKGSPAGESNSQAFLDNFTEVVRGTGQTGCGFEASLEAWYRFLVDPKPYKRLIPGPCDASNPQDASCRVPEGVDETVLQQRADFVRPNSLVAIVMLTDENDCSLMDGSTWPGRASYVAQVGDYPMFRGTSACQTDPSSPDCVPCPYKPDDPACAGPYDAAKDNINLRCFRQKQRFGMDFLWPVKRYVNGLTRKTFTQDDIGRGFNQGFEPERDINPLFCSEYEQVSDPANPGSFIVDRTRCKSVMRDPGLVFLAGIIGVPWQDVAVDPADLKKGYPPVEELGWTREQFDRHNADHPQETKTVPGGVDTQVTVWDQIVGKLDSDLNIEYKIDPLDPLMIDSTGPRSGVNPATGQAVGPVEAATPTANPINGHEWNTGTTDMQYACTFKLPPGKERQCHEGDNDCDCGSPAGKANPLCQTESGTYGTMQYRAKAYPGRRQLAVLKGMDPKQAIVASICAENTEQPDAPDYGYRPAIGAIIDRLKNVLQGTCWNEQLDPAPDGSVQCVVLEATKGDRQDDGTYACKSCGEGRKEPTGQARQALAQDPSFVENDLHCICEIPQAEPGPALDACIESPQDPTTVNGWCYIDPSVNGGKNQSLVSTCPKGQQRMIRFVGAGKPATGSLTYLQCRG